MTIERIYQLFLKHPHVETDSRRITRGCLFFALKGDNFNGNKFAAEALEKGAAFAIIDEKEFEVPEQTILVENVLDTLQSLAGFHRKSLGLPVLAITGTNGKTTTKELIAAVLSQKYKVVYTQGNLNNHIGVPLTLLRMNNATQMGIVEMGANHMGEIAKSCQIADPDFGIITNIGTAHLEGFGSFENIIKTKAELYTHLKNKQGLIFYNLDNSILSELTKGYKTKVSYGGEKSDFSGELISAAPFIKVRVNFLNQTRDISSRLVGGYNFENLLAAACVGHHFNVDPSSVEAAISGYVPQNNRSQLIERNGVSIVMDAYNANPSSMKASIEHFTEYFQPPRSLILGDMLELGEKALEEHFAVLQKISDCKFDNVFLVGPHFSEAAKNYSYKKFINVEELIEHIRKHPWKGSAVLIKGSRGIHLERAVEYL